MAIRHITAARNGGTPSPTSIAPQIATGEPAPAALVGTPAGPRPVGVSPVQGEGSPSGVRNHRGEFGRLQDGGLPPEAKDQLGGPRKVLGWKGDLQRAIGASYSRFSPVRK